MSYQKMVSRKFIDLFGMYHFSIRHFFLNAYKLAHITECLWNCLKILFFFYMYGTAFLRTAYNYNRMVLTYRNSWLSRVFVPFSEVNREIYIPIVKSWIIGYKKTSENAFSMSEMCAKRKFANESRRSGVGVCYCCIFTYRKINIFTQSIHFLGTRVSFQKFYWCLF